MPDFDTRGPKKQRMSIGLVRRTVRLVVAGIVVVVCTCVAVVFVHDQVKLPPYNFEYVGDEADCYDAYTEMYGTCFDVYIKATDPEDVALIAQEIYEAKGYEDSFVQFYVISRDCVTGCSSVAFYSGDETIFLRHVRTTWGSSHGKVWHGVYVFYAESKVPVWLRGYYNWWHAKFGS